MTDKVKRTEKDLLFDVPHTYEFPIVDAWTGLSIAYDYGAVVTMALPEIRDIFAESEVGTLSRLVRLIPRVLTKERLQELCRTFLAGATVDGEVCDDSGMCSVFIGKPHEVVSAVFWALASNYPSYIDPLLADDGGNDTAETPPAANDR